MRSLLLLSMVVFASFARADGKLFAMESEASIPDQRALLVVNGDERTLVVENTAVSDDDALAWVLPVPGEPTVEATTAGVFPTLAAMCRPTINAEPAHVHLVIGGAVVVWMLLSLMLRGRVRRRFAAVGVVTGVVLLVGVGVLLPGLVGAGATLGAANGLEVHEERVGVYDVQVLSGNEDAVVAWLRDGGFVIDDAVVPVIERYASRGWWFVASRLRKDESEARLHPLAVRYRSSKIVYPMAMTAVGSSMLDLDLYVAGSGTARMDAAPGFDVVRSASLQVPNGHRALEALLGGDGGPEWITRLQGAIDLTETTDDLDVEIGAARDLRQSRWSDEAADSAVLLVATGVMLVSLLVAAFTERTIGAVILGVGASGIAMMWMDATLVRTGIEPVRMHRLGAVRAMCNELEAVSPPPDADDAARLEFYRDRARDYVRRYELDLQEIDAPFGYTFETLDGAIVMRTYFMSGDSAVHPLE